MRKAQLRILREKSLFALLLAANAGLVDGTGFVLLAHLFTAHMSGNSVGLGVFLGGSDWRHAGFRAFPIALFFGGLLAGGAVAEGARRRGARSVFSRVAVLELAGLVLVPVIAGRAHVPLAASRDDLTPLFFVVAALMAFAMGVQSAAFRKVGALTVRTTFVTGILTEVAAGAVDFGYWAWDRLRFSPRRRTRKVFRLSTANHSLRAALLYSGVWLLYLTGAVAAGWLAPRWGTHTLLLAALALGAAIALDLHTPIPAP